jgi:hypothetical protein
MSDLLVVSFRPDPGQYARTFGGAAPVMLPAPRWMAPTPGSAT